MLEVVTGAEDHSEDAEIPMEADLGAKVDRADLAMPIQTATIAEEGDTGAMNAHLRNRLRQIRPRSRNHIRRSTRGTRVTNQMEIGETGQRPKKWHPHLRLRKFQNHHGQLWKYLLRREILFLTFLIFRSSTTKEQEESSKMTLKKESDMILRKMLI